MKDSLYKPVDVKGEGGLWGFFNTLHDGLTASKDGYLLVIAPEEKIWRLDDFTPAQEKAFWDFTFAKAAEGVNDPASRGFKENLDDTTTHTVFCALNDGVVAWQGFGTAHSHVIWNKGESKLGDISERLIADRTKFGGHIQSYHPLASIEVDLSQPDYADNIRNAREILKTEFTKAGAPPENIGFSLYTKEAYAHDPRQGGRMVVDLWTKEHHSVASFSMFSRYWNGLWSTPVLAPQPTGLQYAGFRPENPGPA